MKNFFKKNSVLMLSILTVLLLSPISCKKKIKDQQMYQEGYNWGKLQIDYGQSPADVDDAWRVYSGNAGGAHANPPEDFVSGYEDAIKGH